MDEIQGRNFNAVEFCWIVLGTFIKMSRDCSVVIMYIFMSCYDK